MKSASPVTTSGPWARGGTFTARPPVLAASPSAAVAAALRGADTVFAAAVSCGNTVGPPANVWMN